MKDRTPFYHVIQNNVRILSAEIYRLSKIPYYTKVNADRILYLEEVLSAYERDLNKFE